MLVDIAVNHISMLVQTGEDITPTETVAMMIVLGTAVGGIAAQDAADITADDKADVKEMGHQILTALRDIWKQDKQ
jgi:hypothetical protein